MRSGCRTARTRKCTFVCHRPGRTGRGRGYNDRPVRGTNNSDLKRGLLMRMRWIGGCLLVLLIGLVGCRSQVATTEAVPEDTTTHLGNTIDISLADWLKLPRPELAKLIEEWTETVKKEQEAARANIESVQLLPQLHPPAPATVFAEAHYLSATGFSLPPYLKEGQKDAAVGLHLARYGDREAALKLTDTADAGLQSRIDALRGEKNYPVEWTQLTGLLLSHAQLKLANGDPDGATELVVLHRQLRSILDAKAASGPLGSALLGRGKEALALAAIAWREPRWNKKALAADIDAALADWGEVPDVRLALSTGAAQSEVIGLIGGAVNGRAVVARTPLAVQRALDLLDLPLAREGAASVIAFLDDKQALTELLVLFRPKINELTPEPRHLGLALLEHGYSVQESSSTPGVNSQTWTGGGLSYQIAILTRGDAGGEFARIGKAGAPVAPASFARNPRDFGAVNLDRSFEQNRLALAPAQSGDSIEVKDRESLSSIVQPAAEHPISTALLRRESGENLVAALGLLWPADQSINALNRLALPLWAAYGPSRIEGIQDAAGERLVLTWENSTTRIKLRLPFDESSPELIAEDSRGASALKERAEAAANLDRQQRRERIVAGKPRTRLSRSLSLTEHGIDNLRLGMTREQVQAALPTSRSIRLRLVEGGVSVLFLNEPPPTATYWPRQLVIRFGAGDRVAEIRVRYQDGPAAPGKNNPGLLDTIKKKPYGAPTSLPSPWAGLWTDLPAGKSPLLYRWLDDRTCLTYQHDKGGSEVALRDCPLENPLGVALPPLAFCSRGVEGCNLGETPSDLRKRWQVSKPLLASNGAEVLVAPASSPYDVLLVWYEGDKVSRVIARHREPKTLKSEQIAEALQRAWAAGFDHLGYIRRQDGARGQVLQAYSWHDDRTRVRIFAQETEDSIRVFTEWREWPIPPQTVASK